MSSDQTEHIPDQKPRVVSLFAGGGGLHLGFIQAGFVPAFATDIVPASASTFALNAPGTKFYLGDARHLTPSLVAELVGPQPVDIVIGGPPCQGFSTLGDQVQGDPRNALFETFTRIVQWIKPKCILMENTSYLRTQYSGQYEHEIRVRLTSLGYDVFVKTLNAADFGTPQVRKRVFFFATRMANAFEWPCPTHGPTHSDTVPPYRTVGEVIMDIADTEAYPDLANHNALRHSDTVIKRYILIPEGGRLPPPQQLSEDIRRRNFGNTYKRLHRERPALTLVPGNNAFPIHPTENRSLTAREAARLQGFPDDYIFAGSRAEQCKLVGNAVPVDLARNLAQAILRHLNGQQEGELTQTANEPRQLSLPIDFSPIWTASPKKRGTPQTAVSFFTGAGGLMLGFLRAGFTVVASYDKKNSVAKNLSLNFPFVSHHTSDIGQITANDVLGHIGGHKPDVVFGGPPCQGFSIFGKRRFVNTKGHRPEDDERNELTLHYLDIALALEPKIILLENVKGLLSTPRGDSKYIDQAVSRFNAAGYHVQHDVVNCADYGIPQSRERLIIVAVKEGIQFDWPVKKYFASPKSWQRPHVTVGDVICDLMDPATCNADFSHVPMIHKPLVVERYMLIPEGGKLPEADMPEHLRQGYRSDNVRNFSHVYRRLSMDKPATTLVPGHNAFPIHPVLPRALTVREAARIQTFPDFMRFTGTRQQQCTLVGNAVPPVLAELFAQAAVKAMRGNTSQPGYKADHYELKAGE